MKKILGIFFALFTFSCFANETIIFIRHGEKPSNGLGQLSCQGLQRSLKLPKVLISRYGTPNFIFAPNPSHLKEDKGIPYSYIRPLATIEPTAISLGMPVNTQFNFEDFQSMTTELLNPKYENSTIYVAWEHHLAAKITQNILSSLNHPLSDKLTWNDTDFDSIYVLTIDQKNNTVSFKTESQNLNNLPNTCEF